MEKQKGLDPTIESVLREARERVGDSFTLCPRCRCCELIPNQDDSCWNCGGEGYFDLYDEDPLWYDEDEIEMCSECKGSGVLPHFYPCTCDENGNHKPYDK